MLTPVQQEAMDAWRQALMLEQSRSTRMAAREEVLGYGNVNEFERDILSQPGRSF